MVQTQGSADPIIELQPELMFDPRRGNFFAFIWPQMAKKDKTPRKPSLKQTLVKDLKDKIKTVKATLSVHTRNLKSLQGRKTTRAQRAKELLNLVNNGKT